MKHRLLAVTIALAALAAANAFGDWIDDIERPPKGYR
jgi:hypothetical protein